jgi:FAD-linked sulfhydryl oxidase
MLGGRGVSYTAHECNVRVQVKHPPKVESRKELSQYMCELHNEVNKYLGKPVFDCSKVRANVTV